MDSENPGTDCNGLATSPWYDDERWYDHECKWYSCYRDADSLAALYPRISFTISTLGEDEESWQDTHWVAGKRL